MPSLPLSFLTLYAHKFNYFCHLFVNDGHNSSPNTGGAGSIEEHPRKHQFGRQQVEQADLGLRTEGWRIWNENFNGTEDQTHGAVPLGAKAALIRAALHPLAGMNMTEALKSLPEIIDAVNSAAI